MRKINLLTNLHLSMAILLEDVFGEMRMAVANELNANCDSAESMVALYNKYKDSNEPQVFDINNSAQLVTLINQYTLSATDIAKLVQNGTSFVSRNELTGNIEATSIDGLKTKVMNKAGKHIAELIRNPQSNPELYNRCVVNILAPYFEAIANQVK